MPSGIASPHTGPVTRVAGQQAVGIATPGARISRLGPSQCAQNTTQVVAAETGRNLFSLVWQANVNSGDPSGRGVSIFDSNVAPMTIPAHVRAIRFDGTRAFDPRNTSILRRGQLVMFTNLPMSTMGFVGILDPQLPPLDRKSVLTHCYGNTKMSAPTSVDMDVLVTSQSEHEVRRVHLPWLRAAQPAPDPMSGVVWCRRTEFRFPATPGGKLYGTEPRGVVQGRWFFDSRSGIGRFRSKVWVACRGGTGPDNLHNPAIQSYDFETGDLIDNIFQVGGSDLPFGLRSICIDPHHSTHDEVWVTAYGNLVQGPDRVENLELSGTGYQVIRIQDFAPFDDMVLPQIDLIDIGPVSAPEGLYGITSDICGNKYVAGLNYRSNRIHKIDCFGNVNPAGSSFPIEFGRGCNYPFPFSHPPSRHPTGVSMDGRGMLWVQYKNWPKVTRIDPADPATIVDFDCPVYGRPVNIGDFTGYWTAAGLFPLDISDGNRDMSGRTNIEKLRSGENPFFELALPNRQGGSAGCSLSPSTVGPPP